MQLPCPSADNLHSVVACPPACPPSGLSHHLTHISVASMAILPPQVRDQALGQAQESLPESDAGKEYALHRMQVRRGHSTRSRTSCGAGGAVVAVHEPCGALLGLSAVLSAVYFTCLPSPSCSLLQAEGALDRNPYETSKQNEILMKLRRPEPYYAVSWLRPLCRAGCMRGCWGGCATPWAERWQLSC